MRRGPNRPATVIASLTAALLCSAVAAAPAVARPVGGGSGEGPVSGGNQTGWKGIDCAVGELKSVSDDNPGPWTVVFGHAEPCKGGGTPPSGPMHSAEFAVVTFPGPSTGRTGQPAELHRSQIRKFPLDGGGRQFGTPVFGGSRPAFGTCIITSLTTRVACASVTYTPATGYTLKPIRTDDPQVSGPIRDLTGTMDPIPDCNSCF
jgi:hypothetical protein